MLEKLFLAAWYGQSKWSYILWPLMLVYSLVVKNKREKYLINKTANHSAVPVVVVGNITVGGTGKTPIVQALVRYLQSQGYKPGIISRGYGGSITEYPHSIQPQDSSKLVGDEPYMLFHSLNVPVVIDPVRKQALSRILTLGVDVVLSDDGLQHYALQRDIEICVLDGDRGLGNGMLLPVGPLREPAKRLDTVDFTLESTGEVTNNGFVIEPVAWVNVLTGKKHTLNTFNAEKDALAIAGIGNPQKFYKTLTLLGVDCECRDFPDHYDFSEADFATESRQILMTEKDAVKIKSFANENMWYLEIKALLSPVFYQRFTQKLNSLEFERN